MSVCPYIIFNGNCREAVEFYTKVFKTEKQEFMTYGQAPTDQDFAVPDELKVKVMHTHLFISGTMVMFSDAMPGSPFTVGNNVSLAVVTQSIDDLNDYFSSLREGGTVGMEMQETFFSKYYGTVKDKFGIEWQLVFDDEGTFA